MKQGETLRGIEQFKNLQVRKVMEQASIMIRFKIQLKNLFLDYVDEIAATVWAISHALLKLDNSVPQQPALGQMASASPLDYLSFQH